MLADIKTTSGISLAKIIKENETTYTIMYMSAKDKLLYHYEPACEIEKECISGFYNEDDTEEAAGFRRVDGGYVLSEDCDDDYEPSDSDSSEDESLDDEED
jgi:hypothetical protein